MQAELKTGLVVNFRQGIKTADRVDDRQAWLSTHRPGFRDTNRVNGRLDCQPIDQVFKIQTG